VYSEIIAAVESIPAGHVTTYGEIARALGDFRAARAVAEVVRRVGPAVGAPWHRVVSRTGEVQQGAADLLKEEGVHVVGGRVAGLSSILVGAEELPTRPILQKMRKAQIELAKRVSLADVHEEPELVAGGDVSYRWEEVEGLPVEVGRAAVVVVDRDLRVVDGSVLVDVPPMPYVPTYLGFREFPLIARVLQKVDFDVIMVDGHGIAHPAFFGEASHVGVCANVPAIGVAKRRLVGRLRGEEVLYLGRHVGWALHLREGGRPIYISPGHMVSLDGAKRLVKRFRGGTRVPTPVRLAHKLSQFPKAERGSEDLASTL